MLLNWENSRKIYFGVPTLLIGAPGWKTLVLTVVRSRLVPCVDDRYEVLLKATCRRVNDTLALIYPCSSRYIHISQLFFLKLPACLSS